MPQLISAKLSERERRRKPRSREDRLIEIFLEDGHPKISWVRYEREVHLYLPKGEILEDAKERVFDAIYCDLVLWGKHKAYVCEAKWVLNRAVIGDVLTALTVFKELHPDLEVQGVVIYREGKPILEWVCSKLGIEPIKV